MRKHFRSSILLTVAAALILAGLPGCSSMTKEQKGAVIGAAAGGAVGGVVGSKTGSTTRGVIIGAVVGGVAGAIIGHKMDKQAEELKQDIPGATVERVGEGIQVTFASGLLFDFDSDVIRGDARTNLNALADNLNKYDETNLLIAGHTDAIGSESYNQDLSERRAESAARYLRSRGVTRPIQTVGLGEGEPVADNDMESGRSRNRRVEVAIYASEEMVAQAKAEARSQ